MIRFVSFSFSGFVSVFVFVLLFLFLFRFVSVRRSGVREIGGHTGKTGGTQELGGEVFGQGLTVPFGVTRYLRGRWG